MRNLYKYIIVGILSLCLSLASKGQDIHFSHIHASPIYLNPAMTGMFEGDMRLIADFKSQWSSVTTNYQTMYGSADMKTRTMFGTNSAFGFGLEVFSDRAGDLDFRTYGAHFSLSGMRTLDGFHGKKMMTVAAKFGVIGHSVDYSKIIAFDNEPGIDQGIENNLLVMDWSIGLGWFHEMKIKKHMYYLGLSVSHINRPQVDFGLDIIDPENEILYTKFIFHGGADIYLSKQMNIMPSWIFMDQGPHREITMGSYWRYNANHTRSLRKKNISLYLGLWGRWYFEFDGITGFDALIASVRMNMRQTSVTLSYDINLSSLALASNGRGGPEISIIQLLEWRGARRRVHCPSLNW